jgi:tetratricopeptide (TPR) repeat protein
VRHSVLAVMAIGLLITPLRFMEASLETGIRAFEARLWSKALSDFLDVLQQDPSHPEAHAYLTLAARHMEADRESLLRKHRLDILEDSARLSEENRQNSEALTQSLYDTVHAAELAREEGWRTRCDEARMERRAGRLFVAHDLILRVLRENNTFLEAHKELSELQSRVRHILDRGEAATIAERYALEGFYAYGQADYAGALLAWGKCRTFLVQSYSVHEGTNQIRELRFDIYETFAKKYAEEERTKTEWKALFAEGVSFFERAQWRSALHTFRKLAIQNPEYPQLGFYLARSEAAMESDRASRLGATKQQEVEITLQAGIAALEAQRFREARKHFEQTLRLDPSHMSAHSYMKMAEAEMIRRQDPQAAQMHYEAGLIAYASGKLDEAVREWRITLRMNPGHEKARIALGKVQKELAMNRTVGVIP